MNYYAIQVKSRQEDQIVKLAKAKNSSLRFIIPRKTLRIKKMGKFTNVEAPIFSGYIFIEALTISPDDYNILKKIDGFYRFLKSNTNIVPLAFQDKSLLLHFISHNEHADISKVWFDENDRIVVLEGALKGLEGMITKVDRRKARAKVQLSMCDSPFCIDLGFETIEKVGIGEMSDAGKDKG